MSTTVSTRSPGTLSPTRQQLDELDALLKRMLDLPVNQLEDGQEADDAEEPPPPLVQRMQRKMPDKTENAEEPPRPTKPVWSAGSETRAERSARVSDPADGERKPSKPAVSYMVVETASPRPLPPASGFEPQPTGLGMRLVPVAPEEDNSVEEEPEPSSIGGVGDQRRALDPLRAPDTLLAPEPVVLDDSPSTGEETWVPLRSTWKPSAQTWQPLAESWQQARGEIPAPAVMPEPIVNPFLDLASQPREVVLQPEPAAPMPDVIVQRIPVEAASRLSQFSTGETPVAPPPPMPAEAKPSEPRLTLSADDAPVPAILLPLVWFNQGFDACMAPLGAPGRWLCSSAGRQILGALGVLGIVAAAALLVSAGMGWTW